MRQEAWNKEWEETFGKRSARWWGRRIGAGMVWPGWAGGIGQAGQALPNPDCSRPTKLPFDFLALGALL